MGVNLSEWIQFEPADVVINFKYQKCGASLRLLPAKVEGDNWMTVANVCSACHAKMVPEARQPAEVTPIHQLVVALRGIADFKIDSVHVTYETEAPAGKR
jgi:hypothetical protein